MRRNHTYSNQQNGFALATVLILLLILAAVVVVLFDGQKLKVMEAEAVLDAAADVQESHNMHQACVNSVKPFLISTPVGAPSVTVATWWHGGAVSAAPLDVADARWSSSGDCVVEAFGSVDGVAEWLPVVRITSKFTGTYGVKLEQTEWRFPVCTTTPSGSTCVQSDFQVNIKNNAGMVMRTVRPTFFGGQAVQVTHRMD